MTNKKSYTVPEIDIVSITQSGLIAASPGGLPVGGDNVDDSDKSNAFDRGITEE